VATELHRQVLAGHRAEVADPTLLSSLTHPRSVRRCSLPGPGASGHAKSSARPGACDRGDRGDLPMGEGPAAVKRRGDAAETMV
jgi:hypothetical protein